MQLKMCFGLIHIQSRYDSKSPLITFGISMFTFMTFYKSIFITCSLLALKSCSICLAFFWIVASPLPESSAAIYLSSSLISFSNLLAYISLNSMRSLSDSCLIDFNFLALHKINIIICKICFYTYFAIWALWTSSLTCFSASINLTTLVSILFMFFRKII